MGRSAIGHEITVGWFIVVALILGAGGLVLKTQSRGLISSAQLRFQLAHGQGLQSGSPVELQGIRVGEISDVELTPENRVLVTANVANRYAKHIYADAVVTIVESPLGFSATKVSIDPGKTKIRATPGQLLDVNVSETLMDQVASIQSDVRTVIRHVDSLVVKAEGSMDQLQTIMGRVEREEGLVGELVSGQELAKEVHTTITKLKTVSERLESEVLGEAVAAVKDARELIGELRDEKGDMRTLLRNSDAFIVAAKDAVEDARFGETSASLRDAAAAMTKTAARMDVSEETRGAMEAMQRASESFEALSRSLERRPDAVIFGRPTAGSPGVRR
jgi:ABC-type transporter Mla subunit MlaD